MKNLSLLFLGLSFLSVASAEVRYSCEHQKSLAKLSDEVLFGASVKSRVDSDLNKKNSYKPEDLIIFDRNSDLAVKEKKSLKKIANCSLKRTLLGEGHGCFLTVGACDSYSLFTNGYVFSNPNTDLVSNFVTPSISLSSTIKKTYQEARESLENCLCE